MRRPVRHRQALHRATRSCSRDPNVDAVHINSPIPDHAPQSIAALKAGKHVACTVPMATTIEECREIVEAQRKSGKVYMMMETVVYSREYLFVKELYDKGELGRIQFLRGSHQQDMDGWPGYWEGLPPMHYATHCVSPCLALARQARRARRLPRLGPDPRGPDPEVRQPVRDRDRDVQDHATPTSCAEVTRSLFDTARQYRESFDVYGIEEVVRVAAGRERGAGHPHQEHDGSAAPEPEIPEAREGARLRAPAARSRSGGSRSRRRSRTPSTCRSSRAAATAARTRTSSTTFCRRASASSRRCRMPQTSVNWTMVGICAHQSALKGGEKIQIPRF